jgi:hypothetical protein
MRSTKKYNKLEKIKDKDGGKSQCTKMLEVTIKNKELKKRMVEWKALQHECQQELKKEEAWNEVNHAY